MLVLAVSGVKVPLEFQPRQYVTDTPPDGARGFEVPDTVYYQRRIADGDLLRIDEGGARVES